MESLERQVVDDGAVAVELAGELAAIPEEPEDAGELSLSAKSPALVGKEDLAHALKVHRRIDVVGLFRPAREIHQTVHVRDGPVGGEVDVPQQHARPVEREPRGHRRRHRLELLDLNRAARELGATNIRAKVLGARQRKLEIRCDDTPGRGVVVVGEGAAIRVDRPNGGGKPPRAATRRSGPQPRKVVAVSPGLDDHTPVGQAELQCAAASERASTTVRRRRCVRR